MSIKTKNTSKTAVKKTSKPASLFSTPLQDVERCIEKDYVYLTKAYPKVLSDVQRAIDRTTKILEKAKSQSKKSKTLSRKTPTDKANFAAVVNFTKELDTLKSDKSSLTAGYKRFSALQKVMRQFEKAWTKKMKAVSKNKRAKTSSKPTHKEPINSTVVASAPK
jgi:hypothetical protein